jgi:AraC-like DNA-binding protein
MGPQEYMLRQRIEHAMQILRESNLSVKEVADGLGFGSAAAFIRAFRRVQGGTPQAFRRL